MEKDNRWVYSIYSIALKQNSVAYLTASLEGVAAIRLSKRQERIVEIVKSHGPITGEQIAGMLGLTRAALRPDLSILTRSGILDARPRVGYFYNGRNKAGPVSDTLKDIRVGDIKSVPVVVGEKTSVYDAVVTMFTEDVGTLFVVGKEGVLQGVVSRKDLLKTALGNSDLHKIPVNVIMTRMPNIITTTADETVLMAVGKIIDHEIDSLPVVRKFFNNQGEENLEVIGRITKTNLAKLLVELGEGK